MQDWSRIQAYDYTQALSARSWAWEFLRRNPDFKAEWLQTASFMGTLESTSTDLSMDSALSAWGVFFR
jgi:transcriptional regulator